MNKESQTRGSGQTQKTPPQPFLNGLLISFLLIGMSVSLSPNVRCDPGLRHVVVQSPIWISNAGHGGNHLQFCRIPIPHRGTRKPFVPVHRLFSQYGFPCGFPDPWRLATGQPRFI